VTRATGGPEADTAKRHPVLFVEVLSESTDAYEWGLRFERYHQIDTLREVILVEQRFRHVDLFRREADCRWLLESFRPEGEHTPRWPPKVLHPGLGI
jgi:Uma2 family endonuclease